MNREPGGGDRQVLRKQRGAWLLPNSEIKIFLRAPPLMPPIALSALNLEHGRFGEGEVCVCTVAVLHLFYTRMTWPGRFQGICSYKTVRTPARWRRRCRGEEGAPQARSILQRRRRVARCRGRAACGEGREGLPGPRLSFRGEARSPSAGLGLAVDLKGS